MKLNLYVLPQTILWMFLAAALFWPGTHPDALAAPAAAPTVNCAALTLTLKPGLRLGGLHLKPAKDIPPGTVVVALPRYPDSLPSHAHISKPFVQYPSSPYLKTATAEFRTYVSWDALDLWYREAFDACGYDLKASGALARNGKATSFGLWFWSRTDPRRTVSIAFGQATDGESLILYLAQQETLPPRPKTSYLPGGIVRVRVHLTRVGHPAVNRTISSPQGLESLIQAINDLTDVQAGATSCTGRKHGATMRFVPAQGKAIRVIDRARCGTVQVDHTRPLADHTAVVWTTLLALVKGT